MKLFTALRLPPKLTHQITDVQRGVAGARWSEPEKLHITTAYYGEVDDDHAEALDFELARHPLPSLTLQLEGAGHFGHTEPHAIWLGVKDNAGLMALHQHCKHVDRVIAFEKRLSRFNCAPFIVDEMTLFSSHHRERNTNLYREEATYPMVMS